MNFYGHQKVSLVDYPGKVSTLLFVSGCNFECEYCHNFGLKKRLTHTISEDEVIKYLANRKGKIDAVVITGGEPSIYKEEILNFFSRVKKEVPDILTKFDTNGSNPDIFNLLKNVTDFVAMDFKGMNYEKFSNINFDIIQESLENIKVMNDYEIRITMYPAYVKIEEFENIATILKGMKKVVLQQYIKNSFNTIEPYDEKIINEFRDILVSEGIYVEIKV